MLIPISPLFFFHAPQCRNIPFMVPKQASPPFQVFYSLFDPKTPLPYCVESIIIPGLSSSPPLIYLPTPPFPTETPLIPPISWGKTAISFSATSSALASFFPCRCPPPSATFFGKNLTLGSEVLPFFFRDGFRNKVPLILGTLSFSFFFSPQSLGNEVYFFPPALGDRWHSALFFSFLFF